MTEVGELSGGLAVLCPGSGWLGLSAPMLLRLGLNARDLSTR